MEPRSVERRLSAILSADVAGYSRLMGEDDEATLRTLTEFREVFTQRIQHCRGRVVNAPGDSLLAVFASVMDAVTAAVALVPQPVCVSRVGPRSGTDIRGYKADTNADYGAE